MKKTLQQRFYNLPRIHISKIQQSLLLILLITVCSVIIIPFVWSTIYQGKIYPGVKISGIDVGGLNQNLAANNLKKLTGDYLNYTSINLLIEETPEATSSTDLSYPISSFDLIYDIDSTINQAYSVGRQGDWVSLGFNFWRNLGTTTLLDLKFSYDKAKLDDYLDQVADSVDIPGAQAELVYDEKTNNIEVFSGEDGLILDRDNFVTQLTEDFMHLRPTKIKLSFNYQDNQITPEQAAQAKARALELIQKELTLRVSPENQPRDSWIVKGPELIKFIDIQGGFDGKQITEYIESLAEGIDQEPQNATFTFENGKVEEFVPAQNGVVLETEGNINKFIAALTQLENGFETEPLDLLLSEIPPEIVNSEVNNLGINTLIGRGESTFRGSIPSRVHNVTLTASRLHGVLIPPGETFSFNQTIGEISRKTGYQTAYIISGGRTILGDGGGVCQDSTTLFRAVLDAGLPITQWKAHSYRVGYYEQNQKPGFDATVYSPTTDFKFENNTPGNILIQAYTDTKNLTLRIDLYGTDDGRTVEINNYRQWDAVPAPPPLYQDDPTLEPGQIKQIDWAAPGLKTKFDYIVTKDGETLFEKTFYSNFKPWQAVYLRGV